MVATILKSTLTHLVIFKPLVQVGLRLDTGAARSQNILCTKQKQFLCTKQNNFLCTKQNIFSARSKTISHGQSSGNQTQSISTYLRDQSLNYWIAILPFVGTNLSSKSHFSKPFTRAFRYSFLTYFSIIPTRQHHHTIKLSTSSKQPHQHTNIHPASKPSQKFINSLISINLQHKKRSKTHAKTNSQFSFHTIKPNNP